MSHRRKELVRAVAAALARVYFEVSYEFLVGSVGGRRFLALTAAGGAPAHGYLTSDDLEALLTDLDPAPGDRVLDLGCGIGGLALEVHRRSGAQIIGIDASHRAIAEATIRAQRAGLDASVRFLAADLSRPPRVGSASAYAIDSLMFVPDLAQAIRDLDQVLGPDGRLFATLLVVGSEGGEQLRRSLRAADARVERLDDVTTALGQSSRRRADIARVLLGEGSATLRGRLAMRLILGEEALVQHFAAQGRVSRWRFCIRHGSPGGG